MVGNVVELEQSLSTIRGANSRAFLDEMRSETIDATFRESFSTGLAGVLVAVAGVVEFRATSEMLKNQGCKRALAMAYEMSK
jgi:hypothetical protein